MKLQMILNDKGQSVVTLSDGDTLAQAASILDQHRIGAAVAVDRRGKVSGVLSERDIIRRLAELGADALDMKIGDAMTRDVITGSPDDSIDDGLARMTDRRIRHLPIVSDGELVGIVSIGDLVKRKISATEAEAEALKQYIHAG